jgi:hypothetical protein
VQPGLRSEGRFFTNKESRMLQWNQVCAAVIAGVVVAGIAVAPGSASAQQAAPPAAAPQAAPPAAAQQRPVFRARDLMTPAERQTYRESMRGARTEPARKQQLREQWMKTLQTRATERGGVLWKPGMARPAQAEAAKPEVRNAAPREPNRPAPLPPRAP